MSKVNSAIGGATAGGYKQAIIDIEKALNSFYDKHSSKRAISKG